MQDNTINPQNQNSATGPVVGAPPDITPAIPTEIPPVPPSSPTRRRALIPTILGLVLLVVGVGAGLLLVQQQQIFKQKAAEVACTPESGFFCVPDNVTDQCTPDKKCRYISAEHGFAKTPPGCSCSAGGYTDSGGYCLVGFGGNRNCPLGTAGGNTDGGIRCGAEAEAFCAGQTGTGGGGGACSSDYCAGPDQCRSQGGTPGAQGPRPSGGNCTTNTVMCCGLGSSGGGGGTSTPPPLKVCGETCTSDSQCYPTGANGATERCINGICQATSCVGKTIFGRNCDCSNLNACGQPCGASVGLCQSGSQCGFITTASQCLAAEGNTSKQFCLPKNPTNGYTTAQCSGIATIYLINPQGQSGTPPLTQADVIAACQPPATAACSNVNAYDTSWNPLTPTQLSALKAGDKVRFTVTGTTTSGVFDKARFTINGNQQAEVTTKRPNSADFYQEYVIPAGVTSFTVTSQIHHQALNQWF